ncbi:GntR family transcriptional regulator [Mycobacterium saskatchewanense]|uniref:GntR family transcriptional regulator n=1 Tax=Mycobacterium saskatchewanense TaxID=220927 RepID=UPI001F3784B5|nr:GntR family transcriptional regulator [Mycobacterium saskatchewanense]
MIPGRLSQLLGVSRTPVREALALFERDGVVRQEHTRQRGHRPLAAAADGDPGGPPSCLGSERTEFNVAASPQSPRYRGRGPCGKKSPRLQSRRRGQTRRIVRDHVDGSV